MLDDEYRKDVHCAIPARQRMLAVRLPERTIMRREQLLLRAFVRRRRDAGGVVLFRESWLHL
jgi:hypothetical protein